MNFPWSKNPIHVGDKKLGVETNPHINDEVGQSNFKRELQYEIKKYPDGSQYVIVRNGSSLTFKIDSYSDLWTLSQINDVLKHQNRNCILTIPNIIDAQADRRFGENESSGLKLVCEHLDKLKAFHRIFVYHPHNPEVVEALLDRVEIIDNSQFISQVISKIPVGLEDIGKDNHLVLMSSDAGGFKPLMKLSDKLGWEGETFSATKSRKYEDGKSKLIQRVDRQDFGGKDILIIDDICVKGGTFKGLSKMLKERNCGKLYLAVSHMTIQELGDDPVTNYFDKVFTTNSKFDEYWDTSDRNLSVKKTLEIIKIF